MKNITGKDLVEAFYKYQRSNVVVSSRGHGAKTFTDEELLQAIKDTAEATRTFESARDAEEAGMQWVLANDYDDGK